MVSDFILLSFAWVIPYVLVVLVILWVFKLVYDKITHYDDDEQLRSNNLAVGLGRASMYIGVTLAMLGPALSSERDFGWDLLMFAIEGIAAVAVMVFASVIFDKVILPHVDNRKAIGEGNLAVAVAESGAYIGLGFIMMSSLAGGSAPTLLQDIGSGLLFIVLGLGVLMGIYWIFVLLYKRFRKISVIEEIAAGNVAMAVEAGGVLVAMSIVLGCSIIGPFVDWWIDILGYLVAAVAGVLALVIGQLISRRLFLPGGFVREDGTHARNVASACINAAVVISLGVVSGLVTLV